MSSEPEAGTYKDADTFKDSKGQPSQPVLINSGRSGSAWKVITIILTIFSVVLVIGLVTVSVQLANELNRNDGESITTVLNDLQDVPGGGRCDISFTRAMEPSLPDPAINYQSLTGCPLARPRFSITSSSPNR